MEAVSSANDEVNAAPVAEWWVRPDHHNCARTTMPSSSCFVSVKGHTIIGAKHDKVLRARFTPTRFSKDSIGQHSLEFYNRSNNQL